MSEPGGIRSDTIRSLSSRYVRSAMEASGGTGVRSLGRLLVSVLSRAWGGMLSGRQRRGRSSYVGSPQAPFVLSGRYRGMLYPLLAEVRAENILAPQHLLRRFLKHDGSEPQDVDPVGDAGGDRRVLLHQKDRYAQLGAQAT